MPKSKKTEQLEQQLAELTADLQRTRADFENYRKRVEVEKDHARETGKATAILKLLPVIDNIERALKHQPQATDSDADNPILEQWQGWGKAVAALVKGLEKSLEMLNLRRIEAVPGTVFNPDLHEAIQMEDGEGEHEVIVEELQPGYMFGPNVIRHSMVKVKRG